MTTGNITADCFKILVNDIFYCKTKSVVQSTGGLLKDTVLLKSPKTAITFPGMIFNQMVPLLKRDPVRFNMLKSY